MSIAIFEEDNSNSMGMIASWPYTNWKNVNLVVTLYAVRYAHNAQLI